MAAKLLSDKIYPMRTWARLAQNNYDIHELARMEREFCSALDWKLRISPDVLNSFTSIIETFLSTTRAGISAAETPHLDVPPSPMTPELVWSPRLDSLSSSPASLATSKNGGVEAGIGGEIEESKAMMRYPDNEALEFENECEYSPYGMSPRSLLNSSEPVKPSITKRISEFFQGRFSGISKRR